MARRAGLWLGSLVLTGLLLEGGARLVLALMGPAGAPIRVGWNPGEGRASAVRDLVYVPDPDTFFRLAPHLDLGRTANPRIFDLRTDSRGLRSEEPAVPKPAGTLRVVAVGDSCTFGSGAPQASTYPAQLQTRLAGARPARFEVLNAGVPGFTSFQALRFLETEGFGLEPDAVVFASGVNDAAPATAGSKRRFGSQLLSDREYADALRRNRRLGITRLLWRAGLGLAGGAGGEGQPGGVKRRVSPGEYEANLDAFVAGSRRVGSLPVIVVWPLRSQMDDAGPPTEVDRVVALYQDAARSVAQRTGSALVELADVLRGRPALFIDSVHLGPEGYGLVAQQVADALLAGLPQGGNPSHFRGDRGFLAFLEKSPSPTSVRRPLPLYRQQHPLPKRSGPFPSQGAARSRWSAS
ncbi:MAG: GDSL-type esterase/lipase family protein [Myxococcota bacterium]|nr:GDSL-type esterase/lipase family protein [Myxococcota bacterium]